MARYIPEILKEINDAPDVLAALKQYVDNDTLKHVFGFSKIPKGKFLLPQGTPPYTPASTPLGASKSNFANEVTKFHNFLRTDMKSHYREKLFIQLLEDLHPSERSTCIMYMVNGLTRNMYIKCSLNTHYRLVEEFKRVTK